MKVITYDHAFNANEWFVIACLLAGWGATFMFSRIFTRKESVVYYLYALFFGLLLDHTISIEPIDFYDVNDNSRFQLFDFFTYVMYCPFSYLFAYFLKRWNIKPAIVALYILTWALFSLVMEWLAAKAGVFHYKNGYQLFYSFPIYLAVNSIYYLFIIGLNSKRASSHSIRST